MNKSKAIVSLLFALTLFSQGVIEAESKPGQTEKNQFWLGGDISGTTELEAAGIFSYTKDGEQVENTELMKRFGMNAVRLRVWVNPKDHFCDMNDVLVMALRAKENGMAIMIDFHYSDWWADPGHQDIPAQWSSLDNDGVKDALVDHTRSTLQLLKDNGIDVRWVQVGNETTNGFVWPVARLEQGAGENMAVYAALTAAGYEAVKQVYPNADVIVHLDNGYDRDLYVRMFDALREHGCPWDIIGMSVYPFWSKRDQLETSSVTDIIDNINYISSRYGCDVMIVETGVHISDPAAGKIFISRLIDAAIDDTGGRCTGVFYWAPECCHGGYQLGAFKDDKPTEIMDAFSEASHKINTNQQNKIY